MAGVSHPWLQRVELRTGGSPDAVLATYVLNGIHNGFHIGFDRSKRCKPSRSNMKSALENAGVVGQYLEEEARLGRIVGPIPLEWVPGGTQLSPIGVIPKSNQPGKWRLIVVAHGQSVNDGIEPHLCTVEYLRMDEVLGRIAASGRGTQLAKMDIASAHRMVPVHPDDRPLLAVQWAGQVFFDTRLPFGLRSAPKIFTAVATTWMTISQWARRGPTPVPQIWRQCSVPAPG